MEGTKIAPNGRPYAEIDCPQCGHTIGYYDITGSAFYGCTQCHTFFRYENDDPPQVLRSFEENAAISPFIELGQEGYLQGMKFVVIGYVQKHDPNENVTWIEYMLYRPELDNYYVLVENAGEWFAVWKSDNQDVRVMNTNVMNPEYVAVESLPYRKYRFYTGYTYKILYAAGEFDTNILEDEDTLQVEEYENMPDMLVSETKDEKTIWYRGISIPIMDLCRLFDIDKTKIPRKSGLFRLSPDTFYPEWNILWRFTLLLLSVVATVILYCNVLNEPHELLTRTYDVSASSNGWGKQEPINAGIIHVKGPTPVSFNFVTTLINQWVEVSVTCVNVKTGKSYAFTKSIEYYTGYEGGERWDEGNKEATAVLSNVPTGDYQVNVYTHTEAIENFYLVMTVEEDTVLYSNIVLCLSLLLIYPVIQGWRKHYHENEDYY